MSELNNASIAPGTIVSDWIRGNGVVIPQDACPTLEGYSIIYYRGGDLPAKGIPMSDIEPIGGF